MVRTRKQRQTGFTLIEVLLSTTVAIAVISAVTNAIKTCGDATAQLERKARALQTAHTMMERLFLIPYGSAGVTEVTSDQLIELFDDDAQFGAATLHSLSTPLGDLGRVISLPMFPDRGVWRLRVTEDLDNDGLVDTDDELAGDLLRIDLTLDGASMLEAIRGAPAE